MNKLRLLFTTSLLMSTLAGCQQIQTIAGGTVSTISKGVQAYDGWVSKGTMRIWDGMQNKSIRNKFLVLSQNENNNIIKLNSILINDNFKLEKRTFDAIYLEKYITHQANFNEANRKINNSIYISEKDLPAKMFIEQALAKGNEVKQYKNNINALINRSLKQPITEFKGASNRYDADAALIEFDKAGSPVAIMTRSWQTISAIGVDSRIYTNIYFGIETMRWFENSFPNRVLENSLIRTYR
ncbi:hypothetical protein E2R16_12030 [Acinetobacter seifertii]|uniref:Uncharacterized protein n=1 Tax=Acinetobacter seifertii TaxID=1530123 RepID=A0A5E9PF23_9GAMM|nr:hypothetical protein [Acinetobacter seifertii]MDC5558430.1 hypothetical protein [Acinetobacter baumannii]TEU27182.1 hypothetical protein E2R16_12030 [Acinetobacter seifertii]